MIGKIRLKIKKRKLEKQFNLFIKGLKIGLNYQKEITKLERKSVLTKSKIKKLYLKRKIKKLEELWLRSK